MSKATPGPWELDMDPEGGFIITNGPASKDGTWVLAARGPIPHRAEASHANAHVMVAGPDLLEALRPIAAAYPDDPGTSDLYDEQPVSITLGDVRRAWRAIAKAEPR